MDWIFVSHFLEIPVAMAVVCSVTTLVVAGISFGVEIDKDKRKSPEKYGEDFNYFETWKKKVFPIVKWIAGITFLIGILNSIPNIPRAMIEANTTRIKLRYTDMKTVEKLELEVMKRVDKLIDTGIKNLEQPSNTPK